MRKVVSKRRALWHQWASRIGLALIVAVGLAYLPYRLLDGTGVERVPKLREELARTRHSIDSLKTANAQYRREIEALKNDPDAIEEIARDQLGMIRPDELMIRVEGIE